MSTQGSGGSAPASSSPAPATDRDKRLALIRQIEANRGGRLLLSYVTSTRPGFEVQISDDVLAFFHQSLEAGKAKTEKGVDLFLHSNGGSGTAPWRIVNLIREYTKDFTVLVPHHAFSAGTLIALGANKIIMHKMGCLGPIDPSVTNAFNPTHPQNPGVPVPISVEDVSAYFTLLKQDIGIQHEDELIQAVLALTEKIHPLALGNVQRSHHQSRMIARKLLRKHKQKAENEHEIDKLIENLKSNLYYHGHPINREEARIDLGLPVENASPTLEPLIWELYEEYSRVLKMSEPFIPAHEWDKRQTAPTAPSGPPTTQDILTQIAQLAPLGLGIGSIPAAQLVDFAVALIPHVSGATTPSPTKKVRLDGVKGGYVEAEDAAHVFLTDLTCERDKFNTPSGPQEGMKQEIIWQRWETET